MPKGSVRREKKAGHSNEYNVWKRPVCSFSVSPQSRFPFPASLQTFCLAFHAYLNTKIWAVLQSNGQADRQTDKQTNETSAVYSSLVP